LPVQKAHPRIEYNAKDVGALKACREYLTQADEWLDGRREELPQLSGVSVARFPLSTIRKARHEGVDRFHLGWPFVAAEMDDLEAPEEKRSERFFDQWYFVVMSIMELPGGRFLFYRSKNNAYYYLVYVGAGPLKWEGRHFLRRIIANPPSGVDVRQSRDKDGHYDYRRITLVPKSKKAVRLLGQKTRALSQTREDAVRFALELFERQSDADSRILALDLAQDEYERLLRKALEVADKMHEKFCVNVDGSE
jgi:hypothetical protein